MTTRDIPISQIRDPRVVLRPVRRDSLPYIELRDSVADFGVIQSVTVRPFGDTDEEFELIAGLHRLTVSRDLKLWTIPATIKPMTDQEALSIQLQENVLRTDATRMEIARHLVRVQMDQPGITLAALSHLAGKSVRWVKSQLLLMDLDRDIQSKLDRGEIPVMNAYELARLPKNLHAAYVRDAQLMGRDEFREHVRKKLVELQRDPRRGAKSPPSEFNPHPYVRGLKEIQSNHEAARGESDGTWDDAINWVLHLDPPTLAKRKAEYEARSRHHISKETK